MVLVGMPVETGTRGHEEGRHEDSLVVFAFRSLTLSG